MIGKPISLCGRSHKALLGLVLSCKAKTVSPHLTLSIGSAALNEMTYNKTKVRLIDINKN